MNYNKNRNVGQESQKTYQDKLESGFFYKYMSGKGAELGYAGYIPNVIPILENCDGYDLNTPGYDGKNIPVPDGYYDYLYSSHFLEHVGDYISMIKEMFRVVKPFGYIITSVPHKWLYEKKETLPSRFNEDHRRFYTPASLIKEFEDALPINSFRVRHMQDNDQNHDYLQPNDEHSKGSYEIELIIQKLIT